MIGLVVVHWNEPERCLSTVDAFAAQGVPLRAWVVDNGSEPEARARLREGLASSPIAAELVELGPNIGFGPAANVGFRRWLEDGTGDWVVLSPHDAQPLPGCLTRLLDEVAGRPRAGLVCADVGDGHRPVVDPYFGGMTVPSTVADGWEAVGYPHGTLLMARRACLAEIGLFDERYFAYVEEADLGERARRAGWEVGLVHGARVRNTHLSGRIPLLDYLALRNTLLLVRTHFGRYHATIRFLIAIGHLAAGLVRPAGRPMLFAPWARLRALADFARGRFGPPPPGLRTGARRPRPPAPPGGPG